MAGVELIVSLQTNLLDSRPQLMAISSLAAESVRLLANDSTTGSFEDWPPRDAETKCALLRLPGGAGSIVQMVHPADQGPLHLGRAELDPEKQTSHVRLTHPLFVESLEKGVILRARVLVAFADAAIAEPEVATLYQKFAESEPPLTT